MLNKINFTFNVFNQNQNCNKFAKQNVINLKIVSINYDTRCTRNLAEKRDSSIYRDALYSRHVNSSLNLGPFGFV